jgi:hypothetical protein
MVGKSEDQLGRRRCRWKDNIKTDLEGIGHDRLDWIHLSQGRDLWRAVVNTVMHLGARGRAGIDKLSDVLPSEIGLF